MIAKENTRVTVTINRETVAAVRSICSDCGCTVSDLVGDLLDGFLENYREDTGNADCN